MTTSTAGRFALQGCLYALIAAGLYAPALQSGFVADDWEFLYLIDQNPSIAVCFELLADRYFRPLVVLLYFAGYKIAGLWSFPYHLAVVVVHALNAFLLTRVVVSLDSVRREWIGMAAGSLFLVGGNHSEAVAWVGGAADVLLAACLFGGLLALHRALDAARPLRWTISGWVLLGAGLLAKESAVVAPAIALVYGLARVWMVRCSGDALAARYLRRTAAFVTLPALTVALYLVVRTLAFGNPADEYRGLGTGEGVRVAQARAFVLRTFLPPSPRLAHLWAAERDLRLLAGAALVAALALLRRRNRAPLIGSAAALFVSLAPALPLTISLATTETERVIYIPSAFGAAAIVWIMDSLLARPPVVVAVLALAGAAHAWMLYGINPRWRHAGVAFDSVLNSLVASIRAHAPQRGRRVFLLNFPDNVSGAYVFRRGFYAGLHFRAPDLAARRAELVPITSHTQRRAADRFRIRREGPLEFSLDVRPNWFLQTSAPGTTFYDFVEWSPSRFHLRFRDAVREATVLGTTGGQTQFLGDIRAEGTPFGNIDIPADHTVCDGQLRFSGWALDDTGVQEVVVFAGEPEIVLGRATGAVNTRPDVAAVYPEYPHVARAGWDYFLPCELVRRSGGTLRVHVVAVDGEGRRAQLGTRTVHVRP